MSGDPSAWSNLYESHHDALVSSIRSFLGRYGNDNSLVDEIAARVWYALVRNDFELLSRFDVDRGCRLTTFLYVLGKAEARLLLRSERRRKSRERLASRPETNGKPQAVQDQVHSEEEFLAMLTPAERGFYQDVLMASSELDSAPKYSPQNAWQLRHRVRRKLEKFVNPATES